MSPFGSIQLGLYWQPSKSAIWASSSCVNFPVFNLPERFGWLVPSFSANSVKVIPEASQDNKTLFLIERIISPPLLFCDYSNTLLWTFQGTIGTFVFHPLLYQMSIWYIYTLVFVYGKIIQMCSCSFVQFIHVCRCIYCVKK